MPQYVVLQFTEKEKFFEPTLKQLGGLEAVINAQAEKGYRLHTISTSSVRSSGLDGNNRTHAVMIFEKL